MKAECYWRLLIEWRYDNGYKNGVVLTLSMIPLYYIIRMG